MEQIEYQRMAEHETTYWWHVGRRLVITEVIKKIKFLDSQTRIVDIGCGTGANYPLLKIFGLVTGVDRQAEAIAFCRQRQAYDDLWLGDALSIPLPPPNLITAFDVLEHINDDQLALNSWHQALTSGGAVVLTVPAFQFLFGAHDRVLHHVRRYSVLELRTKLGLAGFRNIYISYFFFFTFPLLVISRLLTKQTNNYSTYQATPAIFAWLFIKLSRLEAGLMAHGVKFPWGSSLIVLAYK